ncbi:MAG: response regulator transcription factor [Bacteroidota bacterium]|jgi:DNA-binding NarL/FixJ family response regulator
MEKIKIILVDDHQIVRDGIKALLNDAEDIDVISEAASYNELREKLKLQDPDIIVMDISLPEISGLEITKMLSETYPNLKVLILSMYTGEDFIFNAIKAGAKGYLPKNTTRKEIIDAIHAVYNNNEYYSESISKVILKSYVQKAKTADSLPERAEDKLSSREIEILKYFAGGMSNQEIADKLFISIRTVESHKNHIMQKLELKSTVDLIKYAIKNKIVDI